MYVFLDEMKDDDVYVHQDRDLIRRNSKSVGVRHVCRRIGNEAILDMHCMQNEHSLFISQFLMECCKFNITSYIFTVTGTSYLFTSY